MPTNKRGWHIPTVTLPRIRFGSGQEREESPVMTYYLVVLPAIVLSVFGLVMGFSAQTVTSIAQGENPYTAYARPLLIIVVSLLIAVVRLHRTGDVRGCAWLPNAGAQSARPVGGR